MSAYYGLPPEVRFCTKCSISNQRPCSTVEYKNEASEKKETIDWHAGDVCGACILHSSKEEEIDWEDRDRRLRELCDRFRRDDGTYDCILPGSGGKDSSMTAHLLKYKYGMHPLTVRSGELVGLSRPAHRDNTVLTQLPIPYSRLRGPLTYIPRRVSATSSDGSTRASITSCTRRMGVSTVF